MAQKRFPRSFDLAYYVDALKDPNEVETWRDHLFSMYQAKNDAEYQLKRQAYVDYVNGLRDRGLLNAAEVPDFRQIAIDCSYDDREDLAYLLG